MADVLVGKTIDAELADTSAWDPAKFEKVLTEAGCTVKGVAKP